MKTNRKIVRIDEEKCNGCGLCIPSCAEGALKIIDGKARLVNDIYCDGLGACLGECPQGAIAIEEREADTFDEKAVKRHKSPSEDDGASENASSLGHWPVKLRLVPPQAPFLKGADVVLIADCVPLALADLHRRFVKNNAVLIGCPKFDDAPSSLDNLTAILRSGGVNSLSVVHMEVPCCFGYRSLARQALKDAGREDIPYKEVIIKRP